MGKWNGRNGLPARLRYGRHRLKMGRGDQRAPWAGTRVLERESLVALRAVSKEAQDSRGYNDSSRSYARGRRPGRESLDYRSSGILLLPDMCAAPPAIGEIIFLLKKH